MSKFKLSVLFMTMLMGNAFAAESVSANFQAGATLNSTCSIKSEIDINMDWYPDQKHSEGSGLLTIFCTNKTISTITISPSSPYNTGDDSNTELESMGITPRGVLSGTNPVNKLAYSIFIDFYETSTGQAEILPPNTVNYSYTTGAVGQRLQYGIKTVTKSKTIPIPDVYTDNVVATISY